MFWDLSLFEWSAYLERFHVKVNHIKAVDEGHWQRFRLQWADFRNVHFTGESKPTDLIKLSFDKEGAEEESKPMSFKEAKAALGSKIKKHVS